MANLSTYLLVLALMLALVTASDHRLKVRMKKTGLYDQYSAAPDSKEAVDRSGELDRMFDGSTQTRDGKSRHVQPH